MEEVFRNANDIIFISVSSINRFCEKFFEVSLWSVGASKRCFGVRGVLRDAFGIIRSHMEQFVEKQKNLNFFRFFQAKSEGFPSLFEHFLSMKMIKMTFFKK